MTEDVCQVTADQLVVHETKEVLMKELVAYSG